MFSVDIFDTLYEMSLNWNIIFTNSLNYWVEVIAIFILYLSAAKLLTLPMISALNIVSEIVKDC